MEPILPLQPGKIETNFLDCLPSLLFAKKKQHFEIRIVFTVRDARYY